MEAASDVDHVGPDDCIFMLHSFQSQLGASGSSDHSLFAGAVPGAQEHDSGDLANGAGMRQTVRYDGGRG